MLGSGFKPQIQYWSKQPAAENIKEIALPTFRKPALNCTHFLLTLLTSANREYALKGVLLPAAGPWGLCICMQQASRMHGLGGWVEKQASSRPDVLTRIVKEATEDISRWEAWV